MDDFDIYADENEFKIQEVATVYKLSIPRPTERLSKDNAWVYVQVDQYGIISIVSPTYWFGEEVKDYSVQRDIMEWMVEWEWAEWKQIGPEDSELFATKRLTNAKGDRP